MAHTRLDALVNCRICRQVSIGVFLSISLVEAAILVLSYRNYERDLEKRLEHAGRSGIISGYGMLSHAQDRDLLIFGRMILNNTDVVGGAIYREPGEFVGSFGEAPQMTPAELAVQRRTANGTRLEAVWPATLTGLPVTVVGRLDASWIQPELRAFVWRILGLVLLISLVVFGISMWIVHTKVLRPILAIRERMVAASGDPGNPGSYRFSNDRDDEIGDVVRAFNTMIRRVAESVSSLTRARSELAEANVFLEGEVQERTRNLSTEIEERIRVQKALEENENLLRMVTDSLPAFIAYVDSDLRFRMNNRAYEDWFGIPRDDLVGRHVRDVLGAERFATVRENFDSVLRGETIAFEHRLTNPDGRTMDTQATYVPRLGEDGAVQGFVSLVSDITHLKNAERALKGREAQLRALINNSPGAIHLKDTEGRYLFANMQFETYAGITSGEEFGKTPHDLFPKELADRMCAHDKRVMKSGAAYQREFEIADRNGNPQTRMTAKFPVFGPEGDLIGLGAIDTDITERKNAERIIEERDTRLRALMDSVTEGIVTINDRGIIESVNAAVERDFGYSADDLIGKNVAILMPEPDHSHHETYIKNYLRTGQGKILGQGAREVVGLRKDGSHIPLEITIGEMRVNGQRGFIGSMRDITERKKTEEQLYQAQKMEAVGQLTGGVAHDFNNLLTVILGNLEMLEEDFSDDERSLRRAGAARRAVERGAELTQRLLAFSRRQALEPTILAMNGLVAGMDDMLRRALGETVELKTALAPDLWSTSVDVAQFESALLNLTVNARDAMTAGGRLTIETANVEPDEDFTAGNADIAPGPYAMVAVTDSGTGMPPDVMERVFEPFFTSKDVGKGSGLGLSMVYGFVKQSGGYVSIYSEEGHGTTVKLYFPRAGVEDTAPEIAPAVGELLVGAETILVVEDEAEVRDTAGAILAELGYRVLFAGTGQAALDILEETEDVDLVFTDVVMPGGMSGFDLALKIRERFGDRNVLFTSGYADGALQRHAEILKTARRIIKPYSRKSLARAIRNALGDEGRSRS
ncbi:MAG: PAS domain S-box protein [Rhodospirillales bacterium]|nr:PAS domain S-box protein [Rhodospirillales bacterium]